MIEPYVHSCFIRYRHNLFPVLPSVRIRILSVRTTSRIFFISASITNVCLCSWKSRTYLFLLQIRVRVRIMVFNAIFNNISAISWRPGLLMETRRKPPICRKSLTNLISHNVVLCISATIGSSLKGRSKIWTLIYPQTGCRYTLM